MTRAPKIRRVVCPYCGAYAKLEPVPPSKWRWRCAPCDAHVGCHGYSTRPLGKLADAETREARIRAHEAFDPLWKRAMAARNWSKAHARETAYTWLARCMGLSVSQTHIALFNVDQCEQVIVHCTRGRPLRRHLNLTGD